jgi:hypothetical protein
MAKPDYALDLCIEQEKQKCLDALEKYYKKNKHPSIVRLHAYLSSLPLEDTVLEDLDKIKIYLSEESDELS